MLVVNRGGLLHLSREIFVQEGTDLTLSEIKNKQTDDWLEIRQDSTAAAL